MTESQESLAALPLSEKVAEESSRGASDVQLAEKPPTEAESSIWSAIKESIRGSHRDYTVGPIGRAVILLAIPMVLEMFMESLFAVADIFWVSHLSKEAATTVGLTESMLTLIYALAIGLSIGATATVARRIGERNPDGASRAAVQAIFLALIMATLIAVG